jgi:tetratricopeptide (TPR) repeat protein
MQIVEASDSDSDEAAAAKSPSPVAKPPLPAAKPPSPAAKPQSPAAKPSSPAADQSTGGFKRMQIVEASDSESDEAPAAKPTSPAAKPQSPTNDPHPEIKIAATKEGIEKGKDQGNALFAKGSCAEAADWFAKCLWMIDSGKVSSIPKDLHSILYSNRSFANIKLKNWAEAEGDSSASLLIKDDNAKARYRRAMARFELGNSDGALEDVNRVVKELKDAKAQAEALELKKRIEEKLKQDAPKAKVAEASKPDAGFKRMQIVEASDSDSDEATAVKPSSPAAKSPSPAAKPPSPAAKPQSPVAKPPSPAVADQSAGGWKRMQIVEESDSEADEPSATKPASPTGKPPSPAKELHPEIKIAATKEGIEKGKDSGNALFAKGSCTEAVHWFSKCIWMIDTKKVTDIPNDLHSILYSNRAFAQIALKKWSEAEEDCCTSLSIRELNTKARYRRAMARFELGKTKEALEDVNRVLDELKDAKSQKEASDLKLRIEDKLRQAAAEQSKEAAKEPKPAEQGWKRMQIVEESDSEPDDAKPSSPAAKPTSPAAKPTSPTKDAEPHPSIKIVASKEGIEKAKDLGNSLFSKGSYQECVDTFTKCIWMVDAKKVSDVPNDLLSVLYSNRAFAYIKMQRWADAESSCSSSLSVKEQNMKARYRRAMARYELGNMVGAQEDINMVDLSQREAAELKRNIDEKLNKDAPQKKKPESPKATPEPASKDWKRMEIVEATESDEEAEEAFLEKNKLTQAAEPYPDVKITATKEGVEDGKNKANKLFAAGSCAEAVTVFSKCIWMIDEGKVTGVSSDLHSILYSNRAFANINLKKWAEAESDCSAALAIKEQNTKAKYRRAMARFELDNVEAALEDVDAVLDELMDAKNRSDALELKERIQAKLKVQKGATKQDSPKSQKPKEIPAVEAVKAEPAQPAPATASRSPRHHDIHPDLSMDHTKSGVEKAREQANALFSKGFFEEASRWFSKCISLIDSEQISDAVGDKQWISNQRTVLHSNRAFAYIKLCRWEEAESDCSSSLSICPTGVKALYRRALARIELKRFADALTDIENSLQQQPDNADLLALRDRTRERLSGQSKSAAPPPRIEAASSSPTVSPTQSPSAGKSATGLGPAARAATNVLKSSGSPRVPENKPKNSVELLRNFHSMKKHPDVVARYVREQVPPSVVLTMFKKAPIEPDDLGMLLAAVRSNAQDDSDKFDTDLVSDYLQSILKTHTADIQLGMLSDSEKEVIRELLAGLPAGAVTKPLQASYRKVLG